MSREFSVIGKPMAMVDAAGKTTGHGKWPRLAGVSGAGVRRGHPERSEGSFK